MALVAPINIGVTFVTNLEKRLYGLNVNFQIQIIKEISFQTRN